MTKINLPYVQKFRDRYGMWRHYFRRGDQRAKLPGKPGSKEFMAAYDKALKGEKPEVGTERTAPGSIDALVAAYYRRCADFLTMKPSTQRFYRGVIERYRKRRGNKPVKLMEAKHVRKDIAELVETPAAANNRLKALRSLMRFAVEDGWRDDDPTTGVRKIRHRAKGFHAWTEDEIAQFEAKYPIGTRARLALALLLYTGCRRSDVVTLGRQHIDGDIIRVQQGKTDAVAEVPIVAELAAALNAAPRNHLTFLVTAQGRPFTSTGFYNWFVDCARKAGLPKGCSPHGLRKAISRRLAEAGATSHQLMSVTGHKSLAEAERYTREANRRKMAREGMAALRAKEEQ